jgi:flagellar hook-associated protein 3 FlgL
MRVTTNQLYDQNIRAIMDNQNGLADTQNALSTGKQINKPSDDPVGAAKVIRLTESLDSLTQYQRNNDLASGSMEQQETVLRNITETMNRARVLVVQAGSGIMSDADKKAIGVELEQIKSEVFDLMNAKNASGDYYFSGFQSETQPYVYDPASSDKAYVYQGDSGEKKVQLSNSVTIRSSVSGQNVFENVDARRNFSVTASSGLTVENAVITGQGDFDKFYENNYDPVTSANNDYQIAITSVNEVTITNVASGTTVATKEFASGQAFTYAGMEFTLTGSTGDSLDFSLDEPEKKNVAETLNDISQVLLNDDIADDDYREALNDALVGIDNGLESIAYEVSSIGARLNVSESIYETNLDLEINLKSARSDIEDVDYAKASAEYAKQEVALTAALTTFPKISNLSLFNYIS